MRPNDELTLEREPGQSAASRARGTTWLGVVLLVGCAALLVVQLRAVSFAALFTHLDVGWLLLAVLAFALSLGAAAHNLSAFAPVRLRAVDTVRAQLAVGAVRIVAPSAVARRRSVRAT